jgi:hypothetical protein
MRREMAEALAALNDRLPELDWVDIRERPKAGPIILTDLDAAPEPRNLRRLKAAIRDRWGTVPLLDMLTETALRTGCLDAFTPVGTRGDIAAATLFERLLLALFSARSVSDHAARLLTPERLFEWSGAGPGYRRNLPAVSHCWRRAGPCCRSSSSGVIVRRRATETIPLRGWSPSLLSPVWG